MSDPSTEQAVADLQRLTAAYVAIRLADKASTDAHQEVELAAARAAVQVTLRGQPSVCRPTHGHQCIAPQKEPGECSCLWAFGLNLDMGVTCRKEEPRGSYRLPDPRYDTWGFSWVDSSYFKEKYPGFVPGEIDPLATAVYTAYFKERSLWGEGVRSREAFKQLWTELVGPL